MLELFAVALTIGALVYRNFDLKIATLVIAAVAGALYGWLSFPTKKGLLFSVSLAVMVVIGAIAVHHAERPPPRQIFGDRTFDARVLSVNRQLTGTSLVIRDADYGEKLQVSIHEDGLLPGDLVRIHAAIEAPESFLTPNNRTFDYPDYLASKGIAGVGGNAGITLVKKGNSTLRFFPARISTILRFRIADVFARYLSFPVDGVISGMVVGYQGGIPQWVQDLFRNTGVLHVLVLSGYNVTLLAGFLSLLLRGLPFRLRTILIIASVILLVLVSGSGVASVRAGIMGSIALFAGLTLQTYRPLRALTISYLFFFILSPLSILYDPGFHLSFLATAFMIFVLPKVEKLFQWVPSTAGIDLRELIMLAISAPIFTLPYVMYFSGNVPASSPIANIVLAIVTPVFSIAAALVLAFAWLPSLAHLFGATLSWAGDMVLRSLLWCVKMPLWNAPAIPWWTVTLGYCILCGIVFRFELRQFWMQRRNTLQPAASSSGSGSP